MEKKYKDEYIKKIRTASQVIDMIEDNYYISTGQFAGSPQILYRELHKIKGKAKNVTLQTSLMITDNLKVDYPELKECLNFEAWFYGSNERNRQKNGTVTYVPSHLSQGSARKLSYKKPNMFWGVSAPMDEHGNLNLAYGIAYEMEMLEQADIVVLEVNKNAPRTFGENSIPLSKIDYIVESDIPRSSSMATKPTEIDMEIGKFIASLVEDKSTIQLGIGNIPDAVALSLMGKKDLGIHTEMITDSMIELYERGVVTNKYKNTYVGKIVGTLIYGDEKLYDFVNNNSVVQLVRGKTVNDPFVIMKNDNMVSINTAIQIDLFGQVCSETIGGFQYSGVGGQFDTAYGAQRSKNGKSIIALKSTAKKGEISTIVSRLDSGSAVSLTRNDVDYVVTEYGIAHLRGRSIKERVDALIAIAHPQFREILRKEAIENKLL